MEEDERWISAKEAVKECRFLFALEEWEAQKRLVQLAADEAVRTRCARYVSRGRSGKETYLECNLDSGFWDNYRNGEQQTDWATGFFEAESAYDPIWGSVITTIHGVEFCVTDLIDYRDQIKFGTVSDARPAPRIPQPPSFNSVGTISMEEVARAKEAWAAREARRLGKTAPPQPTGRVTEAEVDGWYAALSETDQARGWRWLWPAAQRHFDPRKPLKKHVLKFVSGRDLGRPKNVP